jgi:hypothetical protein
MEQEALWRPSAERIAGARLSAFMAAVNQPLAMPAAADYASLWRWSVARAGGVLDVRSGTSAECSANAASASRRRRAHAGRALVPASPSSITQRICLRRRDDGRRAGLLGRGPGQAPPLHGRAVRAVSRCAQALQATGVGRGRSRRRLPAEHARGVDRHAGHGFARRHLVVGVARLRRPGRARPFRADRTKVLLCVDGYWYNGKRGRLHGQESPKSPPRCRPSSADVVVSYLDDSRTCPASQWRALRRLRRAVHRRPDRVSCRCLSRTRCSSCFPRAPPAFPSASCTAMAAPAAASQGAPAARRRAARRPHLLLHHLRLDDVELAGVRARLAGDTAALRRFAVRRRRLGKSRNDPFRLRRRRAHDALRHLGQVHRRDCQDRPQTTRNPPPASHCGQCSRPAARWRRKASTTSIATSRRPAAGVDFWRHRHPLVLRARQPDSSRIPRRVAMPRPGHGGRRLRRRWPADSRRLVASAANWCAPRRSRPCRSVSGTTPTAPSITPLTSIALPTSGATAISSNSLPTKA